MKRMLADVRPELIIEWSKRNLPLTPDSVTHGSNKMVWWKGKCGHEWRASIKNRTIGGSGCPYCSHNAILEGFNDLASQKPELAAEWSDRNAPLLPTQVTVFANRKAWWKCRECGKSNKLKQAGSHLVACIYIYYHTNHNTLRHLRQNLRQMKHCDHKKRLII